ncbi:MAG TPA: DUF4347 domain-containing protein, partial [Burkholderiales bacterium]|nr:DUF4347 domain-containing protein [Burkholderiales bacterium]
MAKNSKTPTSSAKKPKTRAALRRRTRMIALEPRMLFDGALGIDLGAKGTAALRGDTSFDAGQAPTPAAPEAQRTDAVGEKPAEKATERAAEKTIESLDSRPDAQPKELVFVDARAEGAQALLKNVDPNARVVILDPARNGIQQIVDALAGESDVSAIHIVAMGTSERLLLGGSSLDASSMQGLNAQRLSSISEHLTSDASILIHGADFGKGDAGSAVANRLALLTSADVADVSDDGTVERVGTPARQEIVFVDPNVRDFQALVDGIDNPNARVVLLDGTRDGVQQIADVVKQYQRVDAIHIISHGSEGQIDLAGSALNAATMSGQYAAQLAEIGKHLGAEADVLIYGCNFGKGADGAAAANELAQLTGADVAASIDDTGDAALGGNWQLEYRTGAVDSDIALDRLAQDSWHDVMALHTLDFDTAPAWTAGASNTIYTIDGYPVTISVSPATNGDPVQSNSYTGGVTPAQNALQFTLGATASNTMTIDFSGQPGGAVGNVGFALWD